MSVPPLPPSAPLMVTLSFALLAPLMALLFVYALGRLRPAWTAPAAAATLAWLAVTAWLAHTGLLARADVRPPPLPALLAAALLLALGLALSRVGAALATLPLWLLVLAQSFRLPLELAMHAAARAGTAPTVMTWDGRNFDVVSGLLALGLGLWLRAGGPRVLAWLFALVGTALLANVLRVALLASPLLQRYGPTQVNGWVAYPPFVWLPTVLVPLALIGQLVLLRALWRDRRAQPTP